MLPLLQRTARLWLAATRSEAASWWKGRLRFGASRKRRLFPVAPDPAVLQGWSLISLCPVAQPCLPQEVTSPEGQN